MPSTSLPSRAEGLGRSDRERQTDNSHHSATARMASRCELVLNNGPYPYLDDTKVNLSFQVVEQEVFPVKVEITLRQNEEKIISDVGRLAQRPGSFGSVAASLSSCQRAFGADSGSSVRAAWAGLSARMLVSALNKRRSVWLFLSCHSGREGNHDLPTWLFGLQQNSETRSNLAIVNLGTEPNRFSIELFDGKTGLQAGRVRILR